MIDLIFKYLFIIMVFLAKSIVPKSEIIHQKEKPSQSETFLEEIYENNSKPKVADACKHSTICQYVDNYPEMFAEKQIRQLIKDGAIDPKNYTQKSGIGPCAGKHACCDVCSQIPKKIKPLAARYNNTSDWFFVLNSNNKAFFQYKSFVCSNPGKPCSGFVITIRDGYHGVCQQEKYENLLYGFDNKGEAPTLRKIQVDSWCSCNITNNNKFDINNF